MRRLLLIALFVSAALPAFAAGPVAPCGQAEAAHPVPAYGPVDGPPVAGSWDASTLRREGWHLPECLGWQGETRLVAALAARFRSARTLDELAGRLTAVSHHSSIRFWAVTRQDWRPLVVDAWALDGPDGSERRPDPPPSALVAGRDFHYVEQPDIGGRATYRMRVLAHTDTRLVLVTENVTPIKAMVTLFEPGALQVASFLERTGPDRWQLYEITRAGAASSSFAGNASAYLNRLEAMRRYLADVPTDRDPPLAPL